MFVTPAFAQVGTGSGSDMFISILPFVLIFVIMYFLIIRPQRQQMKKRTEMLEAVRRGDTVVTGGGLVGKVTKVPNETELEVDLGGGIKVTAVRSMISDVRVKSEPVANQNTKPSGTKQTASKQSSSKQGSTKQGSTKQGASKQGSTRQGASKQGAAKQDTDQNANK